MKFKITLKDPDGFYDAITDAIEDSLPETGINEDERELLTESRRDETNDAISKWVQYNEYITVEIDTDSMTATVCEL